VLAWGIATGLLYGAFQKAAADEENYDWRRNLASRLFYLGRSAFLNGQDFVTAEGIFDKCLSWRKGCPPNMIGAGPG